MNGCPNFIAFFSLRLLEFQSQALLSAALLHRSFYIVACLAAATDLVVLLLGGYGVVMMRWGWCDQWCWWRRWVWCSSALVIVSIVMGGAGGWR
ncbi:hypothetical protein P8452_03401 [Trifolium repens]|nr:hypothetical protein P8452_03401 [Trifolium repens]